ncbi:MAG: hypothetical protein JWM68_1626 [Verrucomicrobiales bacterium]|nr:hypothetical protein [Verrucomicrobiales bacterium]
MVLWVPLTSHCYLEDAGVFQESADKCCADESSQSAKEDPCDTGCKLVEKAAGKVQNNQRFVIPILALISIVIVPQATEVASQTDKVMMWPPETLHLPQFVVTTALPVRGPSLVS